MPSDLEQKLLILILRALGRRRKTIRDTVGCGNDKITEAEKWIKSLPLNEAINACQNEAIERLVARELQDNRVLAAKVGDQVRHFTGEDILRHHREDYLCPRLSFEEKRQFLALVGRWRQQIQFPSIDRLLREAGLRNLDDNLESESSETDEINQRYIAASARHWETMPRPLKPTLTVESEASFKELKVLFPESEVWQRQETWDEAFGVYLEASISCILEIEYRAELDICSLLGEVSIELVDSGITNTGKLMQALKESNPRQWTNLKLLKIVLVCDVCVLAINEQPPEALWVMEVENLRRLRSAIERKRIAELPKDFELPSSHEAHVLAKRLWGQNHIRENTKAFLEAWKTLRTVQSNLKISLDKLEQSISGLACASNPASNDT